MFHHTITWQPDAEVHFRPIQPADADQLMQMHRRSSQASLASRYFRPYMPTMQELSAICEWDSGRGVAYVASVQSEIVGLGYYVVDGHVATAAETAFLVQDGYQRHGIGRMLFHLLAQHALTHQVVAFDAYAQFTNEPMLRILRSAGFALTAHVSYSVLEVHLDLTAPPLAPPNFD